MKRTCKRLTALVLALAMCFSLLAPAWAADVEAAEEVSAEVVAEDTGDVVEEEAEEPVEEAAEEPEAEPAEATAEVAAAEAEDEEPAGDEEDAVVSAQAATSGTCGDNLTWTYSSRILTISGKGDMTDWSSSSNVPWYNNYHNSITQVVIKSGVTSIGDYAFRSCKNLTSITVPDSVTSIGTFAFSGCTGLTNVTIGSGVTTIGRYAFSNCQNMVSISISDTVTSVGDYAFLSCTSLTSVIIPDGVVSIGNGAFDDCTALVTASISDSVTSIGKDAFCECSSLTQIYMGGNVAYIGSYAFGGCDNLTDVFYAGTETDWEAIEIGEMDDTNYLLTATKYYEYDNSISVSAPSLSSLQGTPSGIKVSWKTVSDVTGYQVQYRIYHYSKKSAVTFDVEGMSSSNTTIAGLTSGKSYCVRVRAYKTSGGKTYYSPWSSTKLIRYEILENCTISSLTNTSSGIKVKWSKGIDASGYYIYRKTGSGSYSKIATVTSGSTVSYTDTAVKSKNGTTYTYAVRAYDDSNNIGSYTGKSTVRLTTPTISSLKNVKTKKMTVKWGKNSKATGYQIQYSTSSDFSSYKTVTVTSYKTVSKTISSLTKGKKYYVRVRAYKTVSGTKYYSAWSGKKSVKISK